MGLGNTSWSRASTGSEIHPDWSPGGERIAFIRVTPAGRNELWVVGADGSDAARLYSCDLPCNEFAYPDWAPDGTAIYYGINANATVGPPTTFGVGKFDLASEEANWVLTRRTGCRRSSLESRPMAKGWSIRGSTSLKARRSSSAI